MEFYYVWHRCYAWHNPLFLRVLRLCTMSYIGIMRGIIQRKKLPLSESNKKEFESVYKPSSVVYGHLSRLAVTDKLKRYSRYSVGRTALLTDTQSCSGWGLHGIPCYHSIGELLPRLSILTVFNTAVYFCCTVLKVAFTWRYQAPCPMLLGLSSWHKCPATV